MGVGSDFRSWNIVSLYTQVIFLNPDVDCGGEDGFTVAVDHHGQPQVVSAASGLLRRTAATTSGH
jgi:hypothetical protein